VGAWVLWTLLLSALCGVVAVADETPPEPLAEVEMFTRQGCPHCEKAEAWLGVLERERPGVWVLVWDVGEDAEARARMEAIAEATGTKPVFTPAFYVGGRLIVGWVDAEVTGGRVLALLEGRGEVTRDDEGEGCLVVPVEPEAPCPAADPAGQKIDVPFLGRVSARDLGLPVFTVVLGLLDGFNPCAMWVLLFLLSLLVNLHSRARMFAIAGTFVLVSGLVYFAFMAAWLNFFLLVGLSRAMQVALGCVALFVGIVNVKDFFAFHRGITLSIPESAKPGIYARINRILTAENLSGAIVSVIALAFLVNLVELLCTAGLPAVYTAVLTSHDLPRAQYYGYIALYQIFYMLDDSLMLVIAIITLSRRRLQERTGRWLKFVSGAVMVGLGLVLVFEPGWLSW
jgi:glutaredoxin